MSISTQFLHTIQPVSEDRPAEAVAREILALIRSEYRYTVADLCRIFCCERQWIEDFFVPNIRHIHVNHFFMSYNARGLHLRRQVRLCHTLLRSHLPDPLARYISPSVQIDDLQVFASPRYVIFPYFICLYHIL